MIFLVVMGLAGYYVFNEAVANDAAEIAGKEYVTVPDIVGKHKDDARRLLDSSGLTMGAPSRMVSAKVAPDYVLFQRPAPGEVVRAGRRVFPTISIGATTLEVPDVVGTKEMDARDKILAAQLGSGPTARIPSKIPRDTVIAQYPVSGKTVQSGALVSLLVSDGEDENPRVLVPDLLNLPLEQARARLAQLGLKMDIVKDTTPGATPNVVLQQVPASGNEVVPGSVVTVHVRTDIEIPDIQHRVELRYTVPLGAQDRLVEIVTVARDGTKKWAFPETGQPTRVPAGSTVIVNLRYTEEMTAEVYLDGQRVRRYYYEGGNPSPSITDY